MSKWMLQRVKTDRKKEEHFRDVKYVHTQTKVIGGGINTTLDEDTIDPVEFRGSERFVREKQSQLVKS